MSDPDKSIGWGDLSADVTQDNIEKAYTSFPGTASNMPMKPLFISTFGDLFFESDRGNAMHLDIIALEVKELGITVDGFATWIN